MVVNIVIITTHLFLLIRVQTGEIRLVFDNFNQRCVSEICRDVPKISGWYSSRWRNGLDLDALVIVGKWLTHETAAELWEWKTCWENEFSLGLKNMKEYVWVIIVFINIIIITNL